MSLDDAEHRAAEVLKLRDALKTLYDLLEEYAPHGTQRSIATKRRPLCVP